MQKTGIRSAFMRTFQDYGEEYNAPDCYIEPAEKEINIPMRERIEEILQSDMEEIDKSILLWCIFVLK